MSEPLDLPALDEAATLLDDETPSIGALAVMKRGIKVSPELRAGLAITVVMALTAAVGRLIVPILVQLVLDGAAALELDFAARSSSSSSSAASLSNLA